MLPNVKRAIVVRDLSDLQRLVPEARWPHSQFDEQDLTKAIALSGTQTTPVICVGNSQESPWILAVHPLKIDGALWGVLAIHIETDPAQQAGIKLLLDWSVAWLTLVLRGGEPHPLQANQKLAKLLEAFLECSELSRSATAVTNFFSLECNCERVSIGQFEGTAMRLIAISNTASFDPHSDLAQRLEAIMEAVRTQNRSLSDPPDPNQNPDNDPFHQSSTTASTQKAIFSLPLRNSGKLIGALVFERSQGPEFEAHEREFFESTGKWLGPLLVLKQGQTASRLSLFKQSLKRCWRPFLGPGWHPCKIAALAVSSLVFILSISQGEYRIAAPASLEGKIQRAVVAPFDGFVATAHARAGETVRKSELIAELEDRELQLEQHRWQGQKDELTKQYRKALSELDHAQAQIVKAQIAQTDAQLRLVEQKLQRTQLSAPLDGVIISGDLSRSLGAPVEQGQTLFEIAPLDQYRLVLHIDANEIADVNSGQRGRLTLSSLPNQAFSFVIEQVSPVFQEEDGKINYRTEARIEGTTDTLRPGMQGIGKISVGRRAYAWIFFHPIIDWLRLKIWEWLP